MKREELKRYYEARIEYIKNVMADTRIPSEKKWMLGCTEEAIEDFENCIKEL